MSKAYKKTDQGIQYSLKPMEKKYSIMLRLRKIFTDKFRLKMKNAGKITRPFSSVQFIHSVVSHYLWPHEPQHARSPYPSPTPEAHPNSCSFSR